MSGRRKTLKDAENLSGVWGPPLGWRDSRSHIMNGGVFRGMASQKTIVGR